MLAHSTPQLFLAYAPRGIGLRCALFYFAAGDDLWGWFTGPRGVALVSDYFRAAGFHAAGEPRYVSVDIAGLHLGWADPAICGELERLQDQFRRDWLFSRSMKDAPAELAAYEGAGLASGEINLRYERLARLARSPADWTYSSADFEPAVLAWLAARWPLDYRPASALRTRERVIA